MEEDQGMRREWGHAIRVGSHPSPRRASIWDNTKTIAHLVSGRGSRELWDRTDTVWKDPGQEDSSVTWGWTICPEWPQAWQALQHLRAPRAPRDLSSSQHFAFHTGPPIGLLRTGVLSVPSPGHPQPWEPSIHIHTETHTHMLTHTYNTHTQIHQHNEIRELIGWLSTESWSSPLGRVLEMVGADDRWPPFCVAEWPGCSTSRLGQPGGGGLVTGEPSSTPTGCQRGQWGPPSQDTK